MATRDQLLSATRDIGGEIGRKVLQAMPAIAAKYRLSDDEKLMAVSKAHIEGLIGAVGVATNPGGPALHELQTRIETLVNDWCVRQHEEENNLFNGQRETRMRTIDSNDGPIRNAVPIVTDRIVKGIAASMQDVARELSLDDEQTGAVMSLALGNTLVGQLTATVGLSMGEAAELSGELDRLVMAWLTRHDKNG